MVSSASLWEPLLVSPGVLHPREVVSSPRPRTVVGQLTN